MAEQLERHDATPAELAALNEFNDSMRRTIEADGHHVTQKDLGTLPELRAGILAHDGVVVKAVEESPSETPPPLGSDS